MKTEDTYANTRHVITSGNVVGIVADFDGTAEVSVDNTGENH
jgi:hypothetical protein